MKGLQPESRVEALGTVERTGRGSLPPVVYLHVWPDDVNCAAALAAGLTDRQIISLPRPPLSDGRAPRQYDEWVAHYARLLDELSIDESQPLYLAGWSQGFLFCVDVARERRRVGKATSLVVSLDSSVPWIEYDRHRFLHVMGRQPSWRRRALVAWREMIMPSLREAQALVLCHAPTRWSSVMRERHPNSSFWRTSDPYVSAIYLANAKHSTKYGRCSVDAIIVASERTRARAIDDDLGWHELLTGRIDVVSVPGGHWTFLAGANGPTTVRRLDEALRSADDRHTP